MAQDWPIQRVGSRGENVRTVQHFCDTTAASWPSTASCGPETRKAVQNFQRNRALQVDGIVGNQTWPALIVVLPTGSRGHAVRAVQRQLNARTSSLAVGDGGPSRFLSRSSTRSRLSPCPPTTRTGSRD